MNDQIWQNDRTITFDFIIFWFFCVPETRFWKKTLLVLIRYQLFIFVYRYLVHKKWEEARLGDVRHKLYSTEYTLLTVSENDSPAKFFSFFQSFQKRNLGKKYKSNVMVLITFLSYHMLHPESYASNHVPQRLALFSTPYTITHTIMNVNTQTPNLKP